MRRLKLATSPGALDAVYIDLPRVGDTHMSFNDSWLFEFWRPDLDLENCAGVVRILLRAAWLGLGQGAVGMVE